MIIFLPQLIARCASAGVAFTLVNATRGVALNGISRWLTPQKGLIQQTLRRRSDEHFWFTFFRAAHLLVQRRSANFLYDEDYGSPKLTAECEADVWTSDFLFPRAEFQTFLAGFGGTCAEVRTFASAQGIASGLVVGQLQRCGAVPYSRLNELKTYFGSKRE